MNIVDEPAEVLKLKAALEKEPVEKMGNVHNLSS